jgi:hypothetical protein
MTRDRDEHDMATPEGQRRAEIIDAAQPVAPPQPGRTYLCHRCGKYLSAPMYAQHVPRCGQEEEAVAVPWDEHDEASCRRPALTDYEKRISAENARRGRK